MINYENSEELYKPSPSYGIYKELNLSMEAFFGQTAPLSIILKSFAKDIKTLIGTENDKKNFKDKKYVDSIKNLCEKYGSKISEELNVDKTTIVVLLDKEINAYCIPLITCFDNRPVDKHGDPIDYQVDLDKYVDLENIVQTKTGYRFKNPENKLLLISLNIGLIWKSTEEEIAGIICHELGHCFQQAIFGSYKNYSDLLYATEIKNLSAKFEIFGGNPNNPITKFLKIFTPLPFFGKILMATLIDLCNPSLLKTTIFPKLHLALHKFFHGRIVDEKTFKMKEKLDKLDNNDLSIHEKNQLTENTFVMNTNREKEFKNIEQDTYDECNEVDIYKKEVEANDKKEKSKKETNNFLTALWYDINNKQINFLKFISLSRYAQNTQAKEVFYKKYEFFADIFASAYGFGPALYKNLSKTETETIDFIHNKVFDKCLFKIPVVKAFAIHSDYIRMRDFESVDEHGGAYERASAMYTNLTYELKNNPDLTVSQKKAIQHDIDLLKAVDDQYYKDNEKKGFLYKWFNKVLKKRQTTYNTTIEELILQPMSEVVNEK